MVRATRTGLRNKFMTPKETLRGEWEKSKIDVLWKYHEDENIEDDAIRDWWLSKRDSELKDLIKTVEGMKKEEMPEASYFLLDRHERQKYGEEVKGFNLAIDRIISKIKELL